MTFLLTKLPINNDSYNIYEITLTARMHNTKR